MFAKISAGVVLGAALMVGAVGCESSGESAATREMNANLAKQDKLKREGQAMVAEGSGQRERGVTLREQGVTVEGARDIAEGDGKIASSATNGARNSWKLVRLPLLAIATPPASRSANIGWPGRRQLPPAVE